MAEGVASTHLHVSTDGADASGPSEEAPAGPPRCGLDLVLDVIGGKWKALILWELHEASRRFGELRRVVEGVSEKVLVRQLRDMEQSGLVHRDEFDELPLRVEYSLTPLGASLYAALTPLCEWGERNADAMVRAGSDCTGSPIAS